MQRGQLRVGHSCGQRHQLGAAGANPQKAVAKTVDGLHLAQTHGQLLHGDVGQNADVRRPHGHGVVFGEWRVVAGIPEATDAHRQRVALAFGAGQPAGELLVQNDEALVALLADWLVGILALVALAFFVRFVAHMVSQTFAGGERAAALSGGQGHAPAFQVGRLAVFAAKELGHGVARRALAGLAGITADDGKEAWRVDGLANIEVRAKAGAPAVAVDLCAEAHQGGDAHRRRVGLAVAGGKAYKITQQAGAGIPRETRPLFQGEVVGVGRRGCVYLYCGHMAAIARRNGAAKVFRWHGGVQCFVQVKPFRGRVGHIPFFRKAR